MSITHSQGNPVRAEKGLSVLGEWMTRTRGYILRPATSAPNLSREVQREQASQDNYEIPPIDYSEDDDSDSSDVHSHSSLPNVIVQSLANCDSDDSTSDDECGKSREKVKPDTSSGRLIPPVDYSDNENVDSSINDSDEEEASTNQNQLDSMTCCKDDHSYITTPVILKSNCKTSNSESEKNIPSRKPSRVRFSKIRHEIYDSYDDTSSSDSAIEEEKPGRVSRSDTINYELNIVDGSGVSNERDNNIGFYDVPESDGGDINLLNGNTSNIPVLDDYNVQKVNTENDREIDTSHVVKIESCDDAFVDAGCISEFDISNSHCATDENISALDNVIHKRELCINIINTRARVKSLNPRFDACDTITEVEEGVAPSPVNYYSQPMLFTGLHGRTTCADKGPAATLKNRPQNAADSPLNHFDGESCSTLNGDDKTDVKAQPSSALPKVSSDLAMWISNSIRKTNILKKRKLKMKPPDIFESHDWYGPMDDGGSSVSSGSCGSGSGCTSSTGGGHGGHEEVVLRIHVPELSVERCLTFHSNDLVWTVKQATLTSLPKELRESFNYGLFCPPQNGRAGKFLDEERPLGDYPLSSPMGYLELKYKRRVYKMLKLEEKTLRALHTRANLRRFLEWVKEGNVEKVAKMCGKGLDPNFHCQETGDTPLTLAARGNLKGRKSCAALLLTLVNGGALLDYRTREGLTAMHRAVQADNLQAVRTLLDLGASPNYRDHRGLTPLYYCVTYSKDPLVCEALLHDYAVIGVADHQGWQETHQACRNKLVLHLEHLLFYGADLNGQNASGNTPLHVCAVNNLEDCARVLLFRGCDKNALNFANQNPYQVAVISGNLDLADIISKHLPEDVVPFKSPPRYNPRRRVSGAPLLRATSDPRLENPYVHKPPSPAPSARSIPPFSSASSLSEASTGSGSTASTASSAHHSEHEHAPYEGGGRALDCSAPTTEALSDTSSGVCSGSHSGGNAVPNSLQRAPPQHLQTKVQEDVAEENEDDNEESGSSGSDSSSGGGGSEGSGNDGGGGGTMYDVGTLVVVMTGQAAGDDGQLALTPGDIVQVSGSTDEGLLEGVLRGVTGTFPPSCVQPVRLRNPQAIRDSLIAAPTGRPYSRDTCVSSGGSHYGTAPRTRRAHLPVPRHVVLHRGRKGFGFVLRGAKATSPLMDRTAERGGPALQYLDDVDPGGVADLAGLRPGDYLLKINGDDVSQASHEHVVTLIRKSADLVEMTVITPDPHSGGDVANGGYSPHRLPMALQRNNSFKRGCQTLPRKHNFSRSLFQPSAPPAPPPRDPSTSLSVGRAHARSVITGLPHTADTLDGLPSSSPPSSGPPKLASIKARPASAFRMTASQIEDLIAREGAGSLPSSPTGGGSDARPPKVYASVAEMKKAKALRSRLPGESRGLHKVFHSTPDLQNGPGAALLQRPTLSQEDLCDDLSLPSCPQTPGTGLAQPSSRHSLAALSQPTQAAASSAYSVAGYYATAHDARSYDVSHGSLDHRRLRRSQSAINSSQLLHDDGSPSTPTVGQLVKVDINRSQSEYASVCQTFIGTKAPPLDLKSPSVMSSFRPSDCAKLYASPEQIKTVGYRDPQLLAELNRTKNSANINGNNAKSRSQSLPPTTTRPTVSRSSPEKDTSGDSGIYSSTHSTFRGAENDGSMCDDDLPLPPPPPEEDLITYARPQNNRSVEVSSKLMSSSYTSSRVEPCYADGRLMSASYTGKSSSASATEPDPDYSSEEETTSNSQCDNPKSDRIFDKKKHTVAFAPSVVNKNNVNIKESAQYAAPLPKDTTSSVTLNTTNFTASSSYSTSLPRVQSENFSELIAKKAAERRIRQENGLNSAPSSATSSPNRRNNAGGSTSKGLSDAILESALFNKQKEKASNGNGEASPVTKRLSPESPNPTNQKIRYSKSFPSDFTEDGENSSSGVSSDPEVQQENTFVTVINTESNTISEAKNKSNLLNASSVDESSVSSESSEDASDRTWILTNERGERSDSPGDSGLGVAKRPSTLTKNAVSLVKLPLDQEKTELLHTDATEKEKGLSNVQDTRYIAEKGGNFLPYQHLPSSHPLATSHPLPYHLQGAIHPSNTHVGQAKFSTLQRPHSNSKRFTKAGSDPPTKQNSRNIGGGTLIRSRSTTRDELNLNSGSATLDRKSFHHSDKGGKGTEYERSIDESLQLIRMHMNSLNEVNTLAGIPSSKRFDDDLGDNVENPSSNANETSSGGSDMEVLAPPPQFSDLMTAQHRDMSQGLASHGGGKRSKATLMREQSDEGEGLIRVYKRSNRRLEEEFVAAGEDERTFRNKALDEWSTKDTTDWLESLFMPEYKDSFENKQIDGAKLLEINNESLINLGVRRVGHRVNMEKSLKRYRPVERIDL